MKILLAILLIAILGALGVGLYFLYKDPAQKKRALKSLMVRVGLTILLITLLIFAVQMGWVHPHAVGGQ